MGVEVEDSDGLKEAATPPPYLVIVIRCHNNCKLCTKWLWPCSVAILWVSATMQTLLLQLVYDLEVMFLLFMFYFSHSHAITHLVPTQGSPAMVSVCTLCYSLIECTIPCCFTVLPSDANCDLSGNVKIYSSTLTSTDVYQTQVSIIPARNIFHSKYHYNIHITQPYNSSWLPKFHIIQHVECCSSMVNVISCWTWSSKLKLFSTTLIWTSVPIVVKSSDIAAGYYW
jgi:hypothetical protein